MTAVANEKTEIIQSAANSSTSFNFTRKLSGSVLFITGLALVIISFAAAYHLMFANTSLPQWFTNAVHQAVEKIGARNFHAIIAITCGSGMIFLGIGVKKLSTIELTKKKVMAVETIHRSNIEFFVQHANEHSRKFTIIKENGIQKIEKASSLLSIIRFLFRRMNDYSNPLISALNNSVGYFNSQESLENTNAWQITAAKYNHYTTTSPSFNKLVSVTPQQLSEKNSLNRLKSVTREEARIKEQENEGSRFQTQPIYNKGKWYYMEKQPNHGIEAAFIFMETQAKRLARALTFGKYFQYQTDRELQEAYLWHKPELDPEEPTVQNIGHATLLFQMNGINILTDPIFGDLNPILYPRKTKPGLHFNELPLIDVILISHNHRDHCDIASLKMLVPHQPIMLVPEGDKYLFEDLGFTHVYEKKWWEKTVIQRGEKSVDFFSLPARHWSGRKGFDAQKSITCSWAFKVTDQNEAVYFRGDSANIPVNTMTEIKQFVGVPITANFEPGGPNYRRRWMQSTHQSVLDSMLSHFEVAEKTTTYLMHHNAYELGTDRFDEAIKIKDQILDYLQSYKTDPISDLTIKKKAVLPSFVRKELDEGKFEKIQTIGLDFFITQMATAFLSPKIGERFTLFKAN